jgi:hypothetical protein
LLKVIAICYLFHWKFSWESVVAIFPVCSHWLETLSVHVVALHLVYITISNVLPSVGLICYKVFEACFVALLSEFTVLSFEYWAVVTPCCVAIGVAVYTSVFLSVVAYFAVHDGVFNTAACPACPVYGLVLHSKVLPIVLASVTLSHLPCQSFCCTSLTPDCYSVPDGFAGGFHYTEGKHYMCRHLLIVASLSVSSILLELPCVCPYS